MGMNVTEKRNAAKAQVLENFGIADATDRIGASEYVATVTVDGETMYVGIELTAKNTTPTGGKKPRPGFNLETAIAEYAESLKSAEEKAAAKAAEKAERDAKKKAEAEAKARAKLEAVQAELAEVSANG